VLYVILSVLPIVSVVSPLAFTLKVSGLVILVNLTGAFIYLRARRANTLRAAAGHSTR
jgi:hypothetical protein